MELRVLSLWEPWASAIAMGIKTVETRGWAPPHDTIGTRIAIAATATVPPVARQHSIDGWTVQRDAGVWTLQRDVQEVALHPGHIVATAVLTAAIPTTQVDVAESTYRDDDGWLCITETELAWGNYDWGRWAWLLTDVQRITPVAFRGGQRLNRRWNPNT